MSTLSSITTRRLKEKPHRVTVNMPKRAYESLLQLHERCPELNGSQVICSAIIFAHRNGLFTDYIEPEPVAVKPVEKNNRKEWCELYGGTSDGTNCSFTKYEVGVTGNITKSARTFPLKAMPATQDDFRKAVLGGFVTLGQAEEAFLAQEDDDDDLSDVKHGGK